MRDLTRRLFAEATRGLREVLERGDPLTQARAMRALIAFRGDAAVAVPTLIDLLNSKTLRGGRDLTAIITLGEIGPAAAPAVPLLTERAKESYVGPECIVALAKIGPGAATAVPALIDILLGRVRDLERRPFFIYLAADALGDIGSVEAVPALLQVFRVTEDASTASSVATALGKLGATEAIPDLLHTLRETQDAELPGTIAEALGKLGAMEAVPDLLRTLEETSDAEVVRRVIAAMDELDACTTEVESALELLARGPTTSSRFPEDSERINMYACNSLARIRQSRMKDQRT
jgi:HEAT repeat protein